MSEIEVRRGRTRDGYVQVHHEWFDVYIPAIGTAPFLVWSMLSRYVNNNQDSDMYGLSYPSRDKICRTLKIRNKTFTEAVKTLQELRLIDVTTGDRGQYIYTVHEPPQREEAEQMVEAWLRSREVNLCDVVTEPAMSGSNAEPVPGGTGDERFPRGTGSGSHAEPVAVPTRNHKKKKEKEKLKETKDTIVGFTRVPSEDTLKRRFGSSVDSDEYATPDDTTSDDSTREAGSSKSSSSSCPGPNSEIMRGLAQLRQQIDDDKPVSEWKAPDFVKYFIRLWERTYGQRHPKINWAVEARHMKQYLLDIYGPEKTKAIIDEFYRRRSEFESREYPNIGLHGLRQEWIVRKLLASSNISSVRTANDPSVEKPTVHLSMAAYRKAYELFGDLVYPTPEDYARSRGYSPEKYNIVWIDD